MTTTTTARPHMTVLPLADPDERRRRPLRSALLSVVTVGVIAGGVWGLTAPRGAEDAHGHGSSALATVDLPDGTLRVDGLVDKQVGHVMPGMSMPEDVPAGMRRFAVNISLGATEEKALRYDRRDFTVAGPGVAPVAPVDGQIDRGALTPGTEISGSLSFDVPKDAGALTLRFRDGEGVALPVLPSAAGAHDEHGGAGAPAQAPARAPAPAAEPATGPDHQDAPGTPPHEH